MAEKKHEIIASDKDFDERMEYVRCQQESKCGQHQSVSPGENFSAIVNDMVKYNAKVFLAKAEHYLNLEPTDLVQAGEKIWGAVIFALKKTYLAIQVDVASHAANRALFKLAARVFDSKTQGDLYDVWSLVEKCHENFYGQVLPRTDILEALEGAKLAVRKLESMNMQILRRKFFEERAQPKDLSKFGSEDYQKPYSKVHGGITYYVKVKCY